jgi:hypothetical protein
MLKQTFLLANTHTALPSLANLLNSSAGEVATKQKDKAGIGREKIIWIKQEVHVFLPSNWTSLSPYLLFPKSTPSALINPSPSPTTTRHKVKASKSPSLADLLQFLFLSCQGFPEIKVCVKVKVIHWY